MKVLVLLLPLFPVWSAGRFEAVNGPKILIFISD